MVSWVKVSLNSFEILYSVHVTVLELAESSISKFKEKSFLFLMESLFLFIIIRSVFSYRLALYFIIFDASKTVSQIVI